MTPERLLDAAGFVAGVYVHELIAEGTHRHLSDIRAIVAMMLADEGYATKAISAIINRSRSGTCYAINRARDRIGLIPAYDKIYKRIQEEL